MGFDIYGQAPKSPSGRYFRNNVWWWRPLQVLISLSCQDILTEEDVRELGFNDGYAYSADKAQAVAGRLREIAADEKRLAGYEREVKAFLPDIYHGCWSKENILEFEEFLKNSGGFEVR